MILRDAVETSTSFPGSLLFPFKEGKKRDPGNEVVRDICMDHTLISVQH